MIGFPLRLLAREVYDRVVEVKGASQVALITGEEKILPPQARWFLCTAESMPVADREPTKADFAFVAVDEAQLGADPERGHVFTDRMLHARGREETMILGSESLAPMVRALLPKAEIIGRPRFSTLSYAGPAKLSRLPPRSAIVAFSAEQVYAVAEMLRRMRGGAAVVMGALQPAHPQRPGGDVPGRRGRLSRRHRRDRHGPQHGRQPCRLRRPVQIRRPSPPPADPRRNGADRRPRRPPPARRHVRLARRSRATPLAEFRPEEIEAIEEHRFAPLDFLYWRESELDFGSIEALIRSLERRPIRRGLRAAPEAIDLAVLKLLAGDPEVPPRAPRPNGPAALGGLRPARFPQDRARASCRAWSRASSPISARATAISRTAGIAAEVARLDNVQGDIETLADRIAGVRTWAYIAHRSDWLAEPAAMAERTHGGRGEAVGRAPRAAHPALRRPAHRGADARSRRARAPASSR